MSEGQSYPTGMICEKCDRTVIFEAHRIKYIQAEGDPNCKYVMKELSPDIVEFLLENRPHG